MSKSNNGKVIFIRFIPMGLAITLLCGLLFLGLQQTARLSANDSLTQVAEDLALRLAAEKSIPPNLTSNKIDIEKSLSTYIMVYDANKKLIGATGALNGQNPDFPLGVLDNAKANGSNSITWQPQKGVRSATVTIYFKNKSEGYVVAGKSLKTVEKRIDSLQTQIGIGWLLTLLTVFLAKLFVKKFGS